jgi:hypothetical protein
MTLARIKPDVPKYWLIAIAGVVWSAVGAMLCHRAWGWLHPLNDLRLLALAATGLGLAFVFHRVMLERIARRNMSRICNYAERGCVFAFQAWRSYLIILVMIALGSFLRHTAMPREILAVLYTAMGGALILSSLAYLRLFYRIKVLDAPCPTEDNESAG